MRLMTESRARISAVHSQATFSSFSSATTTCFLHASPNMNREERKKKKEEKVALLRSCSCRFFQSPILHTSTWGGGGWNKLFLPPLLSTPPSPPLMCIWDSRVLVEAVPVVPLLLLLPGSQSRTGRLLFSLPWNLLLCLPFVAEDIVP